MPFTENSSISLTTLQNICNFSFDELKSITKKVIKNAAPNVNNGNLFICLVDFYFYYAIKKGINPLVPIVQTAITTNYLNEHIIESIPGVVEREYNNTARISVNKNIYEGYNLTHTNKPVWLKQKFERWPDSIRAQIDRLSLFLGDCKEITSGETHLSFDPNHYENIVKFNNIAINNQYADSPTIKAMAEMMENTDSSITESNMEKTMFVNRFVQLLNRIAFGDTNGDLLTIGEKASTNNVNDTFVVSDELNSISQQIDLLMHAGDRLKLLFRDIRELSLRILLLKNP